MERFWHRIPCDYEIMSITDRFIAHQDIKPRFHQSRMVGVADGAEGDEVSIPAQPS